MFRRAVLAAALGAAAFALFAVPAGATVIGKATITDAGVVPAEEFCGMTVRHEFSFVDRVQARVGKGNLESAFFGHDNYSAHEVFTNLATGRSMTVDANGIMHDVKATLVSGTIFRFTTINAGQPFVVRDTNGRVVLRDRGVIRETYLFDTEGDDVPGGIFIAPISTRVAGPHPGFELTEDEFCALAQDLIG